MITEAEASIDVSPIIPRLFLGSFEQGARLLNTAANPGITHVVTVGAELPPQLYKKYNYLFVDINDAVAEDISQYFEVTHQYIKEALEKDPNNMVLIHCFAGISRSATITIAFLMIELKIPLHVAMEIVRRSRPFIDPNRGFIRQLLLLNQRLFPDFTKQKELEEYLRIAPLVAKASFDGRWPMKNINDIAHVSHVYRSLFGMDHIYTKLRIMDTSFFVHKLEQEGKVDTDSVTS
jgi:protein-tyrosine phosphatase